MRKPSRMLSYWIYGLATVPLASISVRISFGSYLEAFLLAGLMCFAAALMALLIGFGGRRAQPAEIVPAE